jgi:hypothetical protein
MITKIKHQFKNCNFYKPNWEIKLLFVGTFNPDGGENVPYYYGRKKNKMWDLLSDILKIQFSTEDKDFLDKLQKARIACIDLVDEIEAPNNLINYIIGKGYKDSAIINKKVKRKYNTELINEIISCNPGVCVFTTWGKGSNLKEWKTEVAKLGKLVSLISPSMAARVPKGMKKYGYMLNDWSIKLKPSL